MPYEFHPDLTTPPRKTAVWRYMDFAKFVQMLESRAMWCARIDQLEDPLEGMHTDAELAGIRKHLRERRAQALIDVFRSSRSEVYVNCWRSGPTESLAMWDLYGRGSGIVAVKSTVGRLREAVSAYVQPLYISRVKYVDWNTTPGLDNVLVACSRKDISHEHESEVRLILTDFNYRETKRTLGMPLPVDIRQLITEVMVGSREQEWVVQLVQQVMKRYGLAQPVIASNRLTPRQ